MVAEAQVLAHRCLSISCHCMNDGKNEGASSLGHLASVPSLMTLGNQCDKKIKDFPIDLV